MKRRMGYRIAELELVGQTQMPDEYHRHLIAWAVKRIRAQGRQLRRLRQKIDTSEG